MNRKFAALALAAALSAPAASFGQAMPATPVDKSADKAPNKAPQKGSKKGSDKAATPARPQGDPQINRLKTLTGQLELTDEQKGKIKILIDKATREVEETRLDYQGASRQELQQALNGVYTDLRTNIHDVLTEEQQKKFDALSAQRGGGGGRGGNQMQAVMEQLDLKDDQKAKIETILQDSREKMQGMRDEWRNGDRDAARAKFQAMRGEMETKIKAVLTPDQQAKLKELMPEGMQGGRGQGGRRGN